MGKATANDVLLATNASELIGLPLNAKLTPILSKCQHLAKCVLWVTDAWTRRANTLLNARSVNMWTL